MNNERHSELPVAYQEAIVRGIEAYVAKRMSSARYWYDGIWLGGGLKRLLYFRALESRDLARLYALRERSPEPGAGAGAQAVAYVRDLMLLDVAREMADGQVRVRFVPTLKTLEMNLLRPLYRCMKALLNDGPLFHWRHHGSARGPRSAVVTTVRDERHRRYASTALQMLEPKGWVIRYDGFHVSALLKEFVPLLLGRSSVLRVYARSMDNLLRKHRPGALLTVEGDRPADSVGIEVAKARGVRTACLQWGLPITPVAKIGYREIGADCFLSWGRYSSFIYRKHNRQTEFLEVGKPDVRVAAHDDRPSPARDGTRWRCVFLDQKQAPFVFPSAHRQLVEAFCAAADRHADVEFVLRWHPKSKQRERRVLHEIAARHPNVVVEDPMSVPMETSAGLADVVCSCNTTAELEYLCAGSVPLICNLGGYMAPHQKAMRRLGCACVTTDIDGFAKAMDSLLAFGDYHQQLAQRVRACRSYFIRFTGDRSKQATAAFVERLAGLTPEGARAPRVLAD